MMQSAYWVAHLVKKCPAFYETKGSLYGSQELMTGPCTDRDEATALFIQRNRTLTTYCFHSHYTQLCHKIKSYKNIH
jgi:hypothetical protein